MPQYHPFIRQLHHALRHRCGVTAGDALLVATSGGADSVALLCGLHALASRRTWRLRLTVGHVQHHLRDQAENDARFVEELAHRLDLPFLRRDLHGITKLPGNLEGNLRKARYDALLDIAKRTDAATIATAHHADDQLETLLMRMIRGASARGMAGMRWRRNLHRPAVSRDAPHDGSMPITLIRPLLATDRQTIMDYLQSIDQPWREDRTNADVSRWRARLRRDVLPVLRDLRPTAPQKAQQFAEQMQDISRWLNDEAAGARQAFVRSTEAGKCFTMPRAAARDLPAPVLDVLIRDLLIELGCDSDHLPQRMVHRLTAAINDQKGGERRFELSDNVQLVMTREQIVISRH